MIFTLTYLSTLKDSVVGADLEDVVRASQARNAARGITGLLLVRRRRVMQILEGTEGEVRALFASISADTRHDDVTAVWFSEIRARRFPDWSMGFEDLDHELAASTPGGTAVAAADGRSQPEAGLATSPEQLSFLTNRQDLLRRGLADENRLISTLAIIIYSHDAEEICLANGDVHRQCRQCTIPTATSWSSYPCSTAQNAYWALAAAI